MKKSLWSVLVVDDEVLTREGIIHMTDWSEHGFEIVGEASNGREAMEKIRELSPHIVLTDIRMPVMDGVELTKKVLQGSSPEKPRIIVLSGYSDFEYVRETLKAGASDYLLKASISKSELVEILKKTMSTCLKEAMDKLYNSGLRQLFIESSKQINAEHLKICKIVPGGEIALLMAVRIAGQNTVYVDFSSVFPEKQSASFLYDSNTVVLLTFAERTDVGEYILKLKNKIEANGEFMRVLNVLYDEILLPCPDLRPRYEMLMRKMAYCFYLADKSIYPVNYIKEMGAEPELEYMQIRAMGESHSFVEMADLIFSRLDWMLESGSFPAPENLRALLCGIYGITFESAWSHPNVIPEVAKLKNEHVSRITRAASYRELRQVFSDVMNEVKAAIHQLRLHYYNRPLGEILLYIRDNYDKAITLKDMSQKFYSNKSYLCHLFKSKLNKTFNTYLMETRMKAAKRLLLEPDKSINEVSALVGYSNPGYFSKHFKSFTGLSPREYVKSVLKDTGPDDMF